MKNFLGLLTTPTVTDLRRAKGSDGLYDIGSPGPDRLSPDEVEMITTRDSLYMATVSEDGWPYVQHKGGDAGFVKVLGPTTIGWIERNGNRQYLGSGNVVANGRIALILVDYPSRTRLKLLGNATHHADPSHEMIEQLGGADLRHDGAFTIDVEATNWNCPKYITPRYTRDQVGETVEVLQARLGELEQENQRLRTG